MRFGASDAGAYGIVLTNNSQVTDVERGRSPLPTAREVLTRALPNQPIWRTRVAMRFMSLLGIRQVRAIYGLEHVAEARDPFILAISHRIRREAIIVPALMMLMRDGKMIHFFADWNFLMIPIVGWVMRRGEIIVVGRKSAGPLDFMRRFYQPAVPPADQARALLASGRSVGVFPEGTVSHDASRLLPGRIGAARLSLESGVAIVPAGIRFPDAPRDQKLRESEVMELHIGPRMQPPTIQGDKAKLSEAQAWHDEIMTAIAELTQSAWSPGPRGVTNGDGP